MRAVHSSRSAWTLRQPRSSGLASSAWAKSLAQSSSLATVRNAARGASPPRPAARRKRRRFHVPRSIGYGPVAPGKPQELRFIRRVNGISKGLVAQRQDDGFRSVADRDGGRLEVRRPKTTLGSLAKP